MKDPLKFFLVAGEPSGDFHGAKLIKAIKSLNPLHIFHGSRWKLDGKRRNENSSTH